MAEIDQGVMRRMYELLEARRFENVTVVFSIDPNEVHYIVDGGRISEDDARILYGDADAPKVRGVIHA